MKRGKVAVSWMHPRVTLFLEQMSEILAVSYDSPTTTTMSIAPVRVALTLIHV